MIGIGDILDDKYRILSVLGKGGWGAVYLAENIRLGNCWAIKEVDLSTKTKVNLLAEAEILKRVNHPSLPRIVDLIEREDWLYIVEDYFPGTSLKELIQCRESCTESNVICWAIQLCEILTYLHNLQPHPVIYRDLKPANIIVDINNNVKLIDFGVAREFKLESDTDTVYIGTRGYAAPEQYSGLGQTDARTDIYGLGATLYHTLTNTSPKESPYHQIKPVREVNSNISVGLSRIIGKCMEFEPKRRYQKMEELQAELQELNAPVGVSRLKRLFSRDVTQQAKVVLKEKFRGTTVVSVGGTNRGVGCTHMVIALGAYLTKRNYTVALVELNNHPVYFTLEEDGERGLLGAAFRYKGMDFFRLNNHDANHVLLDVLQVGYDYVILDLGQLICHNQLGVREFSPWYGEMKRADLQILVAGAAIWQLKDLAPYLTEKVNWQLVFRSPDKGMYEQIKNEIKGNIFATAFMPDPFIQSDGQDMALGQILGTVLPKEAPKRGKLLFWK